MLFNRYDFVSVHDGGTLVGKYCGKDPQKKLPPRSYLSTENEVTVVFESDYSVVKKGFKVSYRTGKLDLTMQIQLATHQ